MFAIFDIKKTAWYVFHVHNSHEIIVIVLMLKLQEQH